MSSHLDNSFGNKYDKWEKVMYNGQEHHYYGREGQGPGAYLGNHDGIQSVPSARSIKIYTIPKV